MVTRETSISAGLIALGLNEFVGKSELLAEYAELLLSDGRAAGLIGKSPDVVTRHLLESCALISHMRSRAAFVDVGPGAGLPGVPIAAVTEAPVTLVESRARAAAFLRVALAALAIPGDVVQSPAEDAARTPLRDAAETVVARALAPPPVALELTVPFVRPGGSAVLLVGPTAREVQAQSAKVAHELGARAPEYVSL